MADEAINGAVFANGFRPAAPWFDSTGFRTAALRLDGLSATREPRPAEEFLVDSRLVRGDREAEVSIGTYFTEHAALVTSLTGLERRRGDRAVPLPKPIATRMALHEAIGRRRSSRVYTGDPISLAYLATLLHGGAGVTRRADGDRGAALRSTASAGALYPVEPYVVALRVDGLERGVYAHDARGARLWATGDAADAGAVLDAMAAPDETITTSTAAALLLLVARPWRSMRKYGARGMRHVLIEAGMIAHGVHLAAAALGLGAVDCASLYDDEVHEALDVDGVHEALVHSIVVGVPA